MRGSVMDIERFDGTKERREYKTIDDAFADAAKEAVKPETKRLTIHMKIPGKRVRATLTIKVDKDRKETS